MTRRPVNRDDFPVAIICALKVEYDAVSLLVDWWDDGDRYGTAVGDYNTYKTGRMGNVNIVLVHLSGRGKCIAAAAAASLRSSFSKLKLVLLTGICGGVPSGATDHEMLLGDVIISKTIVQYDIGRQYPGGFEMSDHFSDQLGEMTESVKSLVVTLETDHGRKCLEGRAAGFLKQLQKGASSKEQQVEYKYPGAVSDRLFEPGYRHKHQISMPHHCGECRNSSGSTCDKSRELSCEELGCSDNYAVQRHRLEIKRNLEEHGLTEDAQAPCVFFGQFASGDKVMKSGEHRDEIAKQHGAMAFEMEGAGVWGRVPCIIVKGVCDYADSHKDKTWQGFAAATAASVARALVEHHAQSMLNSVQDRPGQLTHRARPVKSFAYPPRRRGQRGFCYRCDKRSHKLPRCYSREDTVWKGRVNRKDEDRCINCGASDHWWDLCDWEDLLIKRKPY